MKKKKEMEAIENEAVSENAEAIQEGEPRAAEKSVEAKEEEKSETVDLRRIILTRAKEIFPDGFVEGAEGGFLPSREIEVPKSIGREEAEVNYPYTIFAFAKEYSRAMALLDSLIRVGRREEPIGDRVLWLYAAQHSIKRVLGKELYKVELTYIFRIKELPEQTE